MQIRTRVAGQSSNPAFHPIVPVSVANDGYLRPDETASFVQDDGTLVGITQITLRGRYVLSVEISDTDLEELLGARLRSRASETLGAIGRAITSSSQDLDTATSGDSLEEMPITRTARNGRFPFNGLNI